MNVVINALILPLHFFKIKSVMFTTVREETYEMEKLSTRKVNGKSFSYFAVIVRIKIQKILCPIFVIVVTVPKYSF